MRDMEKQIIEKEKSSIDREDGLVDVARLPPGWGGPRSYIPVAINWTGAGIGGNHGGWPPGGYDV